MVRSELRDAIVEVLERRGVEDYSELVEELVHSISLVDEDFYDDEWDRDGEEDD